MRVRSVWSFFGPLGPFAVQEQQAEQDKPAY